MGPWRDTSVMGLCPASTVVRMLMLQTVTLAAATRPEYACSEHAQLLLCVCTGSHALVSSGSPRELHLVMRELRLVLLELRLVVLELQLVVLVQHVHEMWGLQQVAIRLAVGHPPHLSR